MQLLAVALRTNFETVSNGAVNFLTQNVVFLYRQGRNERSAQVHNIGNYAMMPVALLRLVGINHDFPISSAR
jgi:hypothetical protein